MASNRFDPQPPDRSSDAAAAQNASDAGEPVGLDSEGNEKSVNLLHLMGTAEYLSKEYQGQVLDRTLSRTYRAWNNQHAEGSKYLGTGWRGRSRLFVPKSRSAVRKNLATAAAALFSTEDVVNISATFEDDPIQRATAATIKADLDYRMTHSDPKTGIPWFLIAMGGCLDSQLTGVTISKEYWDYEEVETNATEPALVPEVDADGNALLDEDGQPYMVEGEVPVMRAIRDRPMCDLHPIENARVDPAAPWYSPIQLGRWFKMRYPTGLSDARALMRSGGKGGTDPGWLDVDDSVLLKGRAEEEWAGSRRIREGTGTDRYQQGQAPGDLDIIWIDENFIRINGVDYHFWSVGRFAYLSVIRETWEAYPEYDGGRPYSMGFAQLDSHRVFPMPPVESWQPLQLELNDITNLRLDTLKRQIAPIAMVRRGRNVDLAALQRRGQPDVVLQADDLEKDIKFQQTPGPTGASYTETNVTNAQFDELAGVFSTSSVQTNRDLNETVGGMRLMSGAANSVSEFDLRVWTETWVEPALRHLTHLVRFHESDERVLQIAGSKARVMSRFGYHPNLSDFEQTEIMLRVNVGIGAADPMQKLAKLKVAFEMLAPLLEAMKAQGIEIDMEAVIEEVMGGAGYRDGRRFFKFGEPPQKQPDFEVVQLMETMKLEREKLGLKQQEMAQDMRQFLMDMRAGLAETDANNKTKLQVEDMRGRREITKQVMGVAADRDRMHRQAAIDRQSMDAQAGNDRRRRLMEIFAGRLGGQDQPAPEQDKPTSVQPAQPQQVVPAMPDATMLVLSKIVERLDGMSQRDAMTAGVLEGIQRHLTAPAEIVRDPTSGLAVGVRKGGQFQQIVRSPGGNIAGAVPLTGEGQ